MMLLWFTEVNVVFRLYVKWYVILV